MNTKPNSATTASRLADQPVSPMDLVKSLLWRHKLKIVAVPTLVLMLAAAVILYFPRTYQSEARLFLRVGRETIGLDPTATTGQVIGIQQLGQESEILSAVELIGSRGVLGRVVDELGPDYILRGGPAGGAGGGKEPSPIADAVFGALGSAIAIVKDIDPVGQRERALIACESGLSLDAEKRSSVIVIRYETDTPLGAQQIVDKVVEVYQQEHLRIHRNPRSRDFFLEQRDRFQEELRVANGNLRDAKNRMGIASLDARRSALEGRLQSIEIERYNTTQALATAAARVADLRGQISGVPERLLASKRLVPNVGADSLRTLLYELQVREMELKSKYSDSHPLVRTTSAQIEEAQRVVDQQDEQREETTDDVNPIHRTLLLSLKQQETDVAGLKARASVLDDQRAAVLADLEQLNRNEVEIRELEQVVSIAKSKRMKYEDDFEQARIDRELDVEKISSVAVAQPPTFNEKPVSPSKMLVAVGAVLVSIGLTGTWVLASEQLSKPLVGRSAAAPMPVAPTPAVVEPSPVAGTPAAHQPAYVPPPRESAFARAVGD
ncbi:MAG: Wzz/FepE/Etk N-terminal domain-containing protein [Planctomycetota bacterium]